MKFKTVSGSEYEMSDGWIRRTNEGYEKRGDGEWARLLNKPRIEVGSPAYLILEPLSGFGDDDQEEQVENPQATFRTTSLVTEVIG